MAKKIRYRVGDVVSIPLPDGRFVFARIYDDATVAVYRYVGDIMPEPAELQNSGVLVFAAFFDAAIKSGRWRVVGRMPFENGESTWPPPRYVEDILSPGHYQLYDRGELKPATADDVDGLYEFLMYRPEQLEARVRELLASVL